MPLTSSPDLLHRHVTIQDVYGRTIATFPALTMDMRVDPDPEPPWPNLSRRQLTGVVHFTLSIDQFDRRVLDGLIHRIAHLDPGAPVPIVNEPDRIHGPRDGDDGDDGPAPEPEYPFAFDLPADLEGRTYEQSVLMRLEADKVANAEALRRKREARDTLNAEIRALVATDESIDQLLRVANRRVSAVPPTDETEGDGDAP